MINEALDVRLVCWVTKLLDKALESFQSQLFLIMNVEL